MAEIYAVGIGPGAPDLMTGQAVKVLADLAMNEPKAFEAIVNAVK